MYLVGIPLILHLPSSPLAFFARDAVGYRRALEEGRIYLEDIPMGVRVGFIRFFYACLGLMIQFDFDRSSPAARDMESKLFRSHLKIPLVIPQDRQYMTAAYPSEPILVEAASQLLPGSRLDVLVPCALREAQSEGLLSKDNRRQLVGKCIVILAQKRAVTRLLPSSRLPVGYMVAHDHPVSVLALLDETFNAKCFSVNAVDFIIVMHNGSLQNPLSDSSTSQLAFQIQNCTEEVSVLVERQTITPARQDLPILSLFIQLGIEDKSKHRVESFNLMETGRIIRSIRSDVLPMFTICEYFEVSYSETGFLLRQGRIIELAAGRDEERGRYQEGPGDHSLILYILWFRNLSSSSDMWTGNEPDGKISWVLGDSSLHREFEKDRKCRENMGRDKGIGTWSADRDVEYWSPTNYLSLNYLYRTGEIQEEHICA
ncbi:uncharacterized protein BT62DRAFT_920070 [Guyanagaster necrorhizus]|uniref:Uncharacterized protein n=1 Tax=Guyanagaster necrorhizus TaxID=856835 RepID=A0A9P7VSZ4_9AGAR|nr:uncharacterized protein BT62DRAFT_920070 [Guyanagaster necrorhizus MCA 3950]KAG7446007.1 hypothetical protein BT62DRAFT_920070 [Guyanagaster necrorhizus MCA 3950]